ncbi:HAD-IIA family hydrolase [Lapillicoccus sp.]|uniref:HAD-IIA family hydrolase n=1 Tax=Lapillicoccus sp. TaxID=1909287 RepID=UPI0025D4EFDE|nr:HAD-IIA family hydrolase [Lapillicoccus sp.]
MREPLVGSTTALVKQCDAVLFDLDGVLYVGASAVEGARDAVAAVTAAGVAIAFVTNNASRTPATVAEHLRSLGIPARPEDVVTSAQATATVLAATLSAGSRVLVVGGEGLWEALREKGLVPVGSRAEGPVAVAQGFAPDVGWRMLAEGTAAVRDGLPWVASNLDLTIPTDLGISPGNGTLVQVIASASGRRPVVAGKPETPLHLESAKRVDSRHPLVVGDRLDTDIEGANRAGVPSLLVLTGVTTVDDLLRAPPEHRPTYLAEGLDAGLLHPHPPVLRHGPSRWACDGWACDAVDGRLQLTGGGRRASAVRALCVATWESGLGLRDVDDRALRV